MVEEREALATKRCCGSAVNRGSMQKGFSMSASSTRKPPLVCVSGITGSNRRRRIEEIMGSRVATKLDWGRKLLLVGIGIAAAVGPLAMGLVNARPTQAQPQPPAPLSFEVASVKPNKSGDTRDPSMILPGGRFTAT